MRSLILLPIITFVSYGQHMGHSHTDPNLYDCGCATGLFSEEDNFSCDDQNVVSALEKYIVQNNCMMPCMSSDMNVYDSNEAGFRCLQAFTLILQFHDYCATLSVNETLIHEYLDHCPDCLQQHYYYEGANECSGHLNCTDIAAQLESINYVKNNCIDTCSATNCQSKWLEVEGYHRMCYHHELSQDFDSIYDQSFKDTTCDFHCNVPWDHNYIINCSSIANMKYGTWRIEYGDFDVSGILGIVPQTTPGESNAYYYSNIISFICVSIASILP
eukprot:315901_1